VLGISVARSIESKGYRKLSRQSRLSSTPTKNTIMAVNGDDGYGMARTEAEAKRYNLVSLDVLSIY
jgi:hypothetical protein